MTHIRMHLLFLERQSYSKFSEFSIIDTEDLSLFAGTKRKSRNQIHNEQNDAGNKEGVRKSSHGIGNLITELNPVAINPTKRLAVVDDVASVQILDVRGGEESGEDVAGETSNGVNGENIQSIVDTNKELELRGIIARSGADDAEDYRGPHRNVTGPRGDANKTSDDTRTEAHSRPLALQTVIQQTPGNASQ